MNMNFSRKVLLEGRSKVPLNETEQKRAWNTFLGFDNQVNAKYEANSTTRFQLVKDENDEEFGEIVFSDDLYPGTNIGNPNAAVSLKGAVAHELAHFHRWQNKTEIEHGKFTHLDEAMTSLEAVLRYVRQLDSTDIQGLISDSLYRMQLHLKEIDK